MQARTQTSEAAGRLAELDALRGIAALVVAMLVHHYHMLAAPLPPGRNLPILSAIYGHGGSAVDLFFLLSGFVFCHVYLEPNQPRGILRANANGGLFALDRFARLYPLHLLTLLAVTLLVGLCWAIYGNAINELPNDRYHFALNLLFLQRSELERNFSFNHPSWSLTVEAICYVIFYVTARFAPRRFWLLCLLWVIAGVVSPADYVGRGLSGFFIGCLLFRFMPTLLRLSGVVPLAGLVLGVLFVGSVPAINNLVPPDGQFSFLAWPCLVVLAMQAPMAALLRLRPFQMLGELSYSVYLIHVPVQMLLMLVLNAGQPFSPGSIWLMPVYVIVTFVLSQLSFTYLEDPARKSIRKIGRNLLARPALARTSAETA